MVNVLMTWWYTAPCEGSHGAGTWYAEFNGWPARREFEVYADQVLVAPHDLEFSKFDLKLGRPHKIEAIPILMPEFEAVWERSAQPTLRNIAARCPTDNALQRVQYVHYPYPGKFNKSGLGTSYLEFAGGMGRRLCEVYPDHTFVAPFDIGHPLDEDIGDITKSDGYFQAMTHAEFEAIWEQNAIRRLQEIAIILRR